MLLVLQVFNYTTHDRHAYDMGLWPNENIKQNVHVLVQYARILNGDRNKVFEDVKYK